MYEVSRGDVDVLRLDEDLMVMRCIERLLTLGYEFGRAASLAMSQVDVHDLERLIRKGCPRDTAVRIAV